MNGSHNGALTPGAPRRFPEDFTWGAGTSAYQVEGAVDSGGRGVSIWDVFSHAPGNTFRGDTGDVACDSYNRAEEDVALMAELGLNAYRFSIAWPRIQPTGSGPVNRPGIDYYRRLCEALLQHGIRPVATLYHWDLPQALEDAGGWPARETAERFGEYAALVGRELGDLVGQWATINEPLQSVHQGYRVGTHAPGRRDLEAAAAANHHIMLGHGRALAALRATLPAGVPVGASLDPQPFVALDRASEEAVLILDAETNAVYLDPLLQGRYPDAARAHMRPGEAHIRAGDMEAISARMDFLGVNYYRPHYIRAGDHRALLAGESPVAGLPGFVEYRAPELPVTVMDWAIVPDGLRQLLVRLHQESDGMALYITENGCAAEDYVNPDGTIEDHDRISYIHGHLGAALDAIADGVNVCGYFHWSLLDNFEWAWGYARRFGLYHVDFATQKRTPKRSAAFYGAVARSNELGALSNWTASVPAPAA